MVRALQHRARFSAFLPTDPELLDPFARRAEQLGLHALWTEDSLNTRSRNLDALQTLSYAAAVTDRVRLGVAVLYALRRHPATLARELATLDQLSRGRVTAGVGLGNAYHHETLQAVGIPTDRPVARLVELLGVMRALWTQEEAEYDGKLYSFAGIRSQPKPVQQPGPPVWIGARAEPALDRAVRLADGWIGAAPTSTADFLGHLDVVRRSLERHGRDPAGFAVAKGVYVAVEDDTETARRHLTPLFDRSFGTNPVYDAIAMADRVAVFGPVGRCAEQLAVLVDAGVDEIIMYPMYDHLDQLDALAGVVAELAGA